MKKISSKLEIVGNFINNLLHKQNLIIFIGKVGIKIIACYKHQAIDNIFVSYEKDDHFQVCCTFLKNYKKYFFMTIVCNDFIKDRTINIKTFKLIGLIMSFIATVTATIVTTAI